MTKNQKYLLQYKEARTGVELLYNQVQSTTNYKEILEVLNKFNIYMQKIANDRNEADNRVLIAFATFLHNEANTRRSFERVVNIAKLKKLSHKISWKDYQSEIIILRKRGHSWRELEKYCKDHFKIKVSKDTLRNHLAEVANNDS